MTHQVSKPSFLLSLGGLRGRIRSQGSELSLEDTTFSPHTGRVRVGTQPGLASLEAELKEQGLLNPVTGLRCCTHFTDLRLPHWPNHWVAQGSKAAPSANLGKATTKGQTLQGRSQELGMGLRDTRPPGTSELYKGSKENSWSASHISKREGCSSEFGQIRLYQDIHPLEVWVSSPFYPWKYRGPEKFPG